MTTSIVTHRADGAARQVFDIPLGTNEDQALNKHAYITVVTTKADMDAMFTAEDANLLTRGDYSPFWTGEAKQFVMGGVLEHKTTGNYYVVIGLLLDEAPGEGMFHRSAMMAAVAYQALQDLTGARERPVNWLIVSLLADFLGGEYVSLLKDHGVDTLITMPRYNVKITPIDVSQVPPTH